MDVYLDQQCQSQSVGTLNGVLTLMIQTLISSHCSISTPEMWPEDFANTVLKNGIEEYDFVIVGSGAAGSVLAERLSDNNESTILVLEAGTNPPSESMVPYFFKTMYNTSVDWTLRASKSEKFGRGLPNGIPIASGKMLGGFTSSNAFFYVRGNRNDYQTWVDYGNSKWDFNSNLEYFKRSENMLVKEIRNSYDGKYHAYDGLLKVDRINYNDPTKEILLKAIKETGSNYLIDINGDDSLGVVESTGTLTGGKRVSAATSFLVSAGQKKNVHIVKNAFVTSLSNDNNGKITGVNFDLQGKSFKAIAKKEYILAAGSVKTPQIMMLSGIGSASHLKNFGIDAIVDLKGVGQNLQDQMQVPYFIEVPCNASYNNYETISAYFEYLMKNSGTYASSSCNDLLTFINSKNSNDKYPDLQATYTLYSREDGAYLKKVMNGKGYGSDVVVALLDSIKDHCIVKITTALLHPKSRGNILLKSKNPYDNPEINLNYIEDDSDLEALVRGIRRQQKLLNTTSFKNSNIREIVLRMDECGDIKYNTHDYWKCYVKYLGSSLSSLSGTTKMGPKEDENAVVDSQLRVHGIKNLRVAGSSILPSTVSGDKQAVTYMVGERAASFITDINKKLNESKPAVTLVNDLTKLLSLL